MCAPQTSTEPTNPTWTCVVTPALMWNDIYGVNQYQHCQYICRRRGCNNRSKTFWCIANWTSKEVMRDFIVHLCGYLIDLGTIASVADVEQIPWSITGGTSAIQCTLCVQSARCFIMDSWGRQSLRKILKIHLLRSKYQVLFSTFLILINVGQRTPGA